MNFIKNHIASIRILLIWVVFLTLPLYFIPDLIRFDERGYTPIYINLFAGVLAIFIFYYNYNYSIPKLVEKNKFLKYILTLIVSILILFILLRVFVYVIGVSPTVFHVRGNKRLLGGLLPRVVLMIIAAHYIYNNVRSKKIIKEKEKAELQLLKSQIAPHFLFNTLNSLYSLAIMKSDKTAQGILDLSSLMRYVVSETQEERVSLNKELNHLQNYINLQKTRLTNETKVNYTVNGDFKGLKIAPLLLIVFIENAFKYGVSTEEETTISIDIEISNNLFVFKAKNDKPLLNNEQDNTKIGLKNVNNRLNLIYGKKHILLITEKEKSFEVNLKIELV